MRIQNNITAMNTHRMYTANNNAITKSAEKLSSGYRINRAGDDAAGLAISEKMRSQIRGLNMASKNSQDANSMIQTAEGALQEVHSMLQRMNELANQSATGTNENFDRSQISAEFDQLKNEINDISTQTNFNNMKLLDGTLASGSSGARVISSSRIDINKTIQAKATTDATLPAFTVTNQTGLSDQIGEYTITNTSGSKINVAFKDTKTQNITNTTIDLADVTTGDFKDGGAFKVDLSAAGLGTYEMTAVKGSDATNGVVNHSTLAAALGFQADPATPAAAVTTEPNTEATGTYKTPGTVSAETGTHGAITFSMDSKAMNEKLTSKGLESGTYKLSLVTTSTAGQVKLMATDTNDPTVSKEIATEIFSGTTGNADVTFGGLKVTAATATSTAEGKAAAVANAGKDLGIATLGSGSDGKGALKIQVGANEGEQLSISIEKMNVDGLGLTDSKISDQASAGKAITATQDAINLVSEQRSTLGAMQNRLEHKISNLDNTSENLSASEARIRDVDIAKEMTSFTKNQILSQAATAMLAQANSMPQNVLSLLQ